MVNDEGEPPERNALRNVLGQSQHRKLFDCNRLAIPRPDRFRANAKSL